MLKQSHSRGHKPKSIKVKHILQICVLLAVCFWLIYQVKHSQDKRREFDVKSEGVVDKVQTDNEILRIGRKDIPKVTETDTVGEKHVEDDDEKEAEEEENKPEEDEVKHEEDELEREDGTTVEIEEERGGGDDEMDENELEKKEAEHEHGEEDDEGDIDENHAENEEKAFPDENEETRMEDHLEHEEIHDVDDEEHNEKEVASDDHEAREEQYKADDASSEVAHHVQNIIPETENVTMSHANDMFGKVDVGHENETKSSDNRDTSTKTVIEQHEQGNNLTKSDDAERRNLALAILPKSQPANMSNEQQTLFTANVSQNATVEGSPGNKVLNVLANVLGDEIKPKLASDENNVSEASDNLHKTENMTVASQKGNNTDAFEAAKDSSMSNESHVEKLVSNGAGGSVNDPIDESDTNVSEEENESRVDLDTLPDTRSESQIAEETMAYG